MELTAPARPFDALREEAALAAATFPAGYVEIRLESVRTTALEYTPSGLTHAEDSGLTGIHALVSVAGSAGRSYGTGGEGVRTVLARAASNASAGRTPPPPVPGRFVAMHREGHVESLRDATGADRAFLCRRYCELLSASTGGMPCRVAYRDSLRDRAVITSSGVDAYEEESICSFRFDALSGSGLVASREAAGRSGLEFFRGREELVERVAEECSLLSSAGQPDEPEGGILLDPAMAASLAGLVLGRLFEAGAHPLGPVMDSYLGRGARVAGAEVTMVDEAGRMDLPGSMVFDDEGVQSGRNVLVRSGVVEGRLHTLATAAACGARPTGSARAPGPGILPEARFSCLGLAPGRTRSEDILGGMAEGLYLCGSSGGATDMGSFALRSRYAWIVRGGRPALLTGPRTLTGEVLSVLDGIEAVGDDPEFVQPLGAHPAASAGAPHLLLARGRFRAGS